MAQRPLNVGLVRDEDDNLYFDRDGAERKFMFLLDTLEFFGGGFTAVALRHEVADGEYETVGIQIKYESFVPAKKATPSVPPIEEGARSEEPVTV